MVMRLRKKEKVAMPRSRNVGQRTVGVAQGWREPAIMWFLVR
jgi:hypothetical protein